MCGERNPRLVTRVRGRDCLRVRTLIGTKLWKTRTGMCSLRSMAGSAKRPDSAGLTGTSVAVLWVQRLSRKCASRSYVLNRSLVRSQKKMTIQKKRK